MKIGHIAFLALFVLVGFYVGKKWPSLFASVPGVNMVL